MGKKANAPSKTKKAIQKPLAPQEAGMAGGPINFNAYL
jgi:hypothetical protein